MTSSDFDGAYLTGLTTHISALIKNGDYRQAETTLLAMNFCLLRMRRQIEQEALTCDPQEKSAAFELLATFDEERDYLKGVLGVVQLSRPGARFSRSDDH